MSRIVSRETLLVGLAICWLGGVACSSAGSADGQDQTRSSGSKPSTQAGMVSQLIAEADARTLTPALRAAAVAPDSALRETATDLIGRLDQEAVIPMLELALADREPGIRLDAALGLARHPAQDAASREAQLLGAYAAAATAQERGLLIGLLAEVASNASPLIAQALRSESATERAGGCLAAQRLVRRGHPLAAPELERVVELLSAKDPEVARACAASLVEPVARETIADAVRARAVTALAAMASSTEVDTAVVGIEALAAVGGHDALKVLEGGVGSTQDRIAIESVRGLLKLEPLAALAALADKELLTRKRVAVLQPLFAALEAKPDLTEAATVAEHGLRRLGPLTVGGDPHAALARGLAHCAAARLADVARHWPKELLTCGHGQVPEVLREGWIARVLANVVGSDELRAVQLGKLLDKGPAVVRVAAIEAAATLPVKLEAGLLRRALHDTDLSVLAAALRAMGARAALRDLEEPARVSLAELLSAGTHAASAPELANAWLVAARTLGKPRSPASSPNAIKPAAGSHADTAAQTIETTPLSGPDPALIERVTQLARHPAPGVRDSARGLLAEWEAPMPTEQDPVADPLAPDRVPAPSALFHVKLQTTAGLIELELDVTRAPVAAVRFVALVRSGALDGLVVADAAAGRAVAFAPALAEDRPAWRHEQIDAPVERGSVLLQDHGRDAVGPGFALILARAPELDGRAAQLGTIVSGLEAADALGPADQLLEAQVTIGSRQ